MKKENGKWEGFHPVLSLLSYMLKAPLVPPGTPVVNALFAQRQVTSDNGRGFSSTAKGGGGRNETPFGRLKLFFFCKYRM